jgi:hypothetical protein
MRKSFRLLGKEYVPGILSTKRKKASGGKKHTNLRTTSIGTSNVCMGSP